MLLKLKICTTVLVAYEIIVILLAHFKGSCNALFGYSFCNDHVFKYFILCFAIPAIVWLIGMWIAEIVHTNRRHHSLMYRAKSAVRDAAGTVREKIRENVSPADMEKLLAAALLIGVKKYLSKNSSRRREFKKILDGDLNDIEFDSEFDVEDDDEDDDESDTDYAENRRASTKKKSRKK